MMAKLPKGKRGDVDLAAILERAAAEVDVRIVNLRPTRCGGWRFVLRPFFVLRPSYFTWGHPRPPYTRLNHTLDRTVAAVCWHGHRDFFRAAYAQHPELAFKTGFIAYRGAEDFELRYRATGYRNIGSQAQPCMMADACYCDEGVEYTPEPDCGRGASGWDPAFDKPRRTVGHTGDASLA